MRVVGSCSWDNTRSIFGVLVEVSLRILRELLLRQNFKFILDLPLGFTEIVGAHPWFLPVFLLQLDLFDVCALNNLGIQLLLKRLLLEYSPIPRVMQFVLVYVYDWLVLGPGTAPATFRSYSIKNPFLVARTVGFWPLFWTEYLR